MVPASPASLTTGQGYCTEKRLRHEQQRDAGEGRSAGGECECEDVTSNSEYSQPACGCVAVTRERKCHRVIKRTVYTHHCSLLTIGVNAELTLIKQT